MRWIAWMKSLNLKPMPRKIAQWQWRWKLQPEPAITGFVARYWIRPSEKSMIARSRSSRSCVPHTLTASGTAASIARRSASRSCQSRKCSSGASASDLAHLRDARADDVALLAAAA